MRGMAAFATASTTMMAACSLGVVDLSMEPMPAELLVTSKIEPDPGDPTQVLVTINAALDPGIEPDGSPRRLTSGVLWVEGKPHSPSRRDDPSPTWTATESYPAPGPEGIRLGLPQLEGFGATGSITMRVRVAVTPGDTISLGDGEDLVIRAEPPSNPAETLSWSLDLRSPSVPTYRLKLSGGEPWPAEVRVAPTQIPPGAMPLHAALRIRWDRRLTLFEGTPDERYELGLRSIMVVDWIVAPGE